MQDQSNWREKRTYNQTLLDEWKLNCENFKKNYRITLWLHLKLGKDFLNKTENIQSTKEKNDKFDSIFLGFSMTKYAIKKFKDNQLSLVIVNSYR